MRRYELPNLNAVSFVLVGLLGEGVAASARPDPQAKGLGEYLRSRYADIPADLLDHAQRDSADEKAWASRDSDDARVWPAVTGDGLGK